MADDDSSVALLLYCVDFVKPSAPLVYKALRLRMSHKIRKNEDENWIRDLYTVPGENSQK